MPRLFVGLRPPSLVRDGLLDAMTGIENARWQDDDQLHVTLRFVGEVDERRADDLADALAAIRVERFDSEIAGSGYFERKGVPSAVWAKVVPDEALSRLQRRVERACRSVGLEAEGRKFVPHVTMARLNRSSGPIGDFLAQTAMLRVGPWPNERFVLFESRLTDHRSEYDEVVHFPLIRVG